MQKEVKQLGISNLFLEFHVVNVHRVYGVASTANIVC
jgi:hypothetical protein